MLQHNGFLKRKRNGVDGKNLAVVGNSVGGNMTAAITLMAKDKKGPAIKLQVFYGR